MGRKGRRAAAITATGVKTPDYWESVVRQGCVYASGTDRASDREHRQARSFSTRGAPQMTRPWTHTKALDRSRSTQRISREPKGGPGSAPVLKAAWGLDAG
jgi:hypothetical protein